MASLFDKIKGLNIGQTNTRTLPGGDTYNVANASKMNIGAQNFGVGTQDALGYEVKQPEPVQQSNLQFNPSTQQSATSVTDQTATGQQITDEDVARLGNSINSIMSGGKSLFGGTDYIGDIFKLQAEQAGDYRSNRGLYQMPEGVVLSPEQQDQIRQSADRAYGERFAALGFPASAQTSQMKTGVYGTNFENLTPEAEGLLNAGLIGGGTEAERNRAIKRMAEMSPEEQKRYAQSMVYQKMSVGERDAYNQMDKTISGASSVLSRMPADLTQNPIKYQATRISEYLGGSRSPEYQNFISLIGNVKAPIINQTYGAAVTGSEYARALEWLPGLESQSMETVVTNLKNLAAFSEYARDAQTSMYLGLPKPDLNNYLNKWQNGEKQGKVDINSVINAFKQEGYSDQEIQQFLKSKGLGFNQVGNTTASAPDVQDVMNRIASVESGGNYQALGPTVTKGMYRGERALGKYQVMPGNLPQWSREALGVEVTPQQFLQNPKIQDQIVAHRMSEIYKKYGNWDDVASVWFTGKPQSQGSLASDDLGTTGSEYVRRFNQARTQS